MLLYISNGCWVVTTLLILLTIFTIGMFYNSVLISRSLCVPCRQAGKLRRVVREPLRGVRQRSLPVLLQGLPLFKGHCGPQLLCHLPESAVTVCYVAGHHWRSAPWPPSPHSQRWTARGPAGWVHQTQKALRPLPGGQGTARIPHTASCCFFLCNGQVMNGVGVSPFHWETGSRALYHRTLEILVLVHDVIHPFLCTGAGGCRNSYIRKHRNQTSKQICLSPSFYLTLLLCESGTCMALRDSG